MSIFYKCYQRPSKCKIPLWAHIHDMHGNARETVRLHYKILHNISHTLYVNMVSQNQEVAREPSGKEDEGSRHAFICYLIQYIRIVFYFHISQAIKLCFVRIILEMGGNTTTIISLDLGITNYLGYWLLYWTRFRWLG